MRFTSMRFTFRPHWHDVFVFAVVASLVGLWCFTALNAWLAHETVLANVDGFTTDVIAMVNAHPPTTTASKYTIWLNVATLAEGLWYSCQGGCSPPQEIEKTCFYKFLVESMSKNSPHEGMLYSDPGKWVNTKLSAYLSSVIYSKIKNMVSIVLACFIMFVLVVRFFRDECVCAKNAADTDADTNANSVTIVIDAKEATV